MANRTEQLKKIVRTAESLATFGDVKKFFDVLARLMRDFRTEIIQITAKNKDEMNEAVKRVDSKTEKIKSEVLGKLSKLEADLRSDNRTTTRMIKQDFNNLREVISDIDLTPLQEDFSQRLAEIEQKISELPEEKDVEDMIVELEKKITNLENRTTIGFRNIPRGSGGGVSALGVRQAFKYIFHTEAPTGDIDSVNLTYTVQNEIWAVIGFSLNGEVIAELPNYTVSGRTITFSTALPASFAGKDFEIRYIG